MAVSTDLIKSSAELGAGVATLAFAASSGAPLLSGITATGVALAGIGAALLGQKTVKFGPALEKRIATQLKSAGADLPEDADWVIALKLNLRKLTLTREAAAQLSTQDGGYTANATRAFLERLAQSNPVFHDPTRDARGQTNARKAAEMIISAGVQAAFADRAAFEALEPALLEQALSKLGDIDRKADRIEAGVETSHDKLDQILTRMQQLQELTADGGRGVVSKETVETLACLLDDFDGDLDQQVSELIRRLDAAEALIEEGQHPGNVDAFIREVQRRVSDLTRSNDLNAAQEAFESGLEQFRQQQAERREADTRNELALLHTGILMATASGDVESVLRYELQRLEVDSTQYKPELNLYIIWQDYYIRAQRQSAQFDMQICLRLAEQGFDQTHSSEQFGVWLRPLGMSKSLLAQARGELTLLESAITDYQAALQEYTPDSAPIDWAMIQNSLGNALAILGEHRGDWALLGEAIKAFQSVLEVFTQERTPLDWAATQNNLGNVLQALGWQQDDETLLEDAISSYKAALEEYRQDCAPMDWAMTQNNLGNVLQTLGQKRGDETLLEDAITAYKAALEIRTQDSAPMAWATTQSNMGNVFAILGEQRGNEAFLEDAVTAYQAALAVRTQNRAPMAWAMTQNNLGDALCSLGAFKGEAETIECGISKIDSALSVYNEAGAEGYAIVSKFKLIKGRELLKDIISLN